MTKESVYLNWLRDTHAMEKHAETLLNTLTPRLNDHLLLKALFTRYLEQTVNQQQQVRNILKQHDTSWSALKEALGRMSPLGQAVADMLREDEDARLAASGYMFCHYKVASYTLLLSAAQHAEDRDAIPVLQHILQQEAHMADLLLQQLPEAANVAIEQHAAAELNGTL